MVALSWEQFQRPNQSLEEEKENEFSQEVQGDIQDEIKPEGEKPQWGNFQTPETFQGDKEPTDEEGTFEWIARNVIAGASRIGEQIGGSRGNIEKFSKDVLVNFPKQSGGVVGWAVSELLGPERWEKLIRGSGHQLFPTSEQLKEASQKITGGYTEPKTAGEKKFQEFEEDIGSTLTGRKPFPVPGRNRATQIALNNLVTPAAANIAKEIVKETGFGEDKANLAKVAVWTPLTLISNVSATRFASDLMNRGRNGVPNNLNIDVPRYLNRLKNVERTMNFSDPRTQLARSQLGHLRDDVAAGRVSVRDAMNMFDGTNALKRNRGMFEMDRTDQNFARSAIDQVKNQVRDEIIDASQAYPNALENWRNGVQAWAVIHRSRALTNTIESWARGPYAKILTGPAAGLFGIGGLGAVKAPLVSMTGTAITPALYKSGQTVYRMWEDPRLANYYWNAIGAAQQHNAPVFISNYLKLNKELEKSDSMKKKSKSKK